MSKQNLSEKQIFNSGDLISLRSGIPTYPYFLSLKKYEDNSKMNIESFSNDKYLVIKKIFSSSNKKLIGYECLSSNGKVYVMDIDQYDINLEVGFCFIKV